MSDHPAFPGFPQEALDFLRDLADNNNRDWFEAHKETYLRHVLDPAQDFVQALGERLKTISGGIMYDARPNGGSILRIYRDVRFSKDKTPYNANVRVVFWEGKAKRTDNPGYYLWIDPSGAGVFCGLHGFPKPVLEAYRQAVVDDALGTELERAIAEVQSSGGYRVGEAVRAAGGYQVGGSHYKRVPRGYAPDHPRAVLLKHNGLYAHVGDIPPEVITTPEFVEVCFQHCRNMAPLQQWLVKMIGVSVNE